MSRLSRKCSISDCTNHVWSREMCHKHYSRWREHGDAAYVSSRTLVGAPMAFINALPTKGDGCVSWPYSVNSMGYANIKLGGKTTAVCRIVCERTYGPSPGRDAAHECGNGHLACVAPWHLTWKTKAENMKDKVRHGTAKIGEKHPRAKLTESKVRQIRHRANSASLRSLASEFGVSDTTICHVISRRYWANVP